MRPTLLSYFLLLQTQASRLPLVRSNGMASLGSVMTATRSIVCHTRGGNMPSLIARQFRPPAKKSQAPHVTGHIVNDSHIPPGSDILTSSKLLVTGSIKATVSTLSCTIKKLMGPNRSATAAIAPGAKISEGIQIDTGKNRFLKLSVTNASLIAQRSNRHVSQQYVGAYVQGCRRNPPSD